MFGAICFLVTWIIFMRYTFHIPRNVGRLIGCTNSACDVIVGSRTFHPFCGSPPDGSPLHNIFFHPYGRFTSDDSPLRRFHPRTFHLPDISPPGHFTPRKVHPPKCSPLRNISNFQGALKLCTKQIN